ncbi:rCG42216, isoform CRA_b [Rattus norvegicus]|uniref:RCG42216, isoform CRA_b n=1 Tax=Rattus norvegicus TaxID=10116 RepID=A6K057_RAT|nr:rCG42216, isoform CRA_b [Rattus norvegicus]
MYFIFKVTAITHGPILLAYCFLCYVKRSAEAQSLCSGLYTEV